MAITNVSWKCDRCSAEQAANPGSFVPADWAGVSVTGPFQALMGNLCADCTQGFEDFMNASGGGPFVFKKPEPPPSNEGGSP